MPKSLLDEFSNLLVGQTVTGAVKGVGEGIGYLAAGGELDEVDDLIMKTIGQHKQESIPQTKAQEDWGPVGAGLAAMSNPISAIGHGIDFAAAVPDMVEQKLSGAEPELGQIAESGLKRRLAKGGAQAAYALKETTERSRPRMGVRQAGEETVIPLNPPGSQKFQIIQDRGDGIRSYMRDLPAAGQTQRIAETVGKVLERVIENPPYKDPKKQLDLIQKLTAKKAELDELVQERVSMSEGYTSMEATPHKLGAQIDYTPALKSEYRGKGYGSQMYQNMADEFGGAISDIRSTSDEARAVYERLGARETSSLNQQNDKRLVIPPSFVKDNPKALAEFEAFLDKYNKGQEKKYAKEADMNRFEEPADAFGAYPDMPRVQGKIEIEATSGGVTGSRSKMGDRGQTLEESLIYSARERETLRMDRLRRLFPNADLPKGDRERINFTDGRFRVSGDNGLYNVYLEDTAGKKQNIKVPEFNLQDFGLSQNKQRDLDVFQRQGIVSRDSLETVFNRPLPDAFSDGKRIYQYDIFDGEYKVKAKK